MTVPTIRLKTLRQLDAAAPEPFCPSPAYVSYTQTLVRDGMCEPAKLRRGFWMTEAGKRELVKLEAIWQATRRRAA